MIMSFIAIAKKILFVGRNKFRDKSSLTLFTSKNQKKPRRALAVYFSAPLGRGG